MVRQTAAISSPFYAVLDYPNDSPPDLKVWYRSAWAKNPTLLATYPASMPVWVMIQRTGNLFSAGVSTDGTNYTLIPGSTADVDLPTTTMQGLAVDSGSSTSTGTATFSNINVGSPVSTTHGAARAGRPVPVRLDLRRPRKPHPARRHHRFGQFADAGRHRHRLRRQFGLGALRLSVRLGQRVDQRAGHHPARRVGQDPGRADDAGQRQPHRADVQRLPQPGRLRHHQVARHRRRRLRPHHPAHVGHLAGLPGDRPVAGHQREPSGNLLRHADLHRRQHLDTGARLGGADRHGLGQLPGRARRHLGHSPAPPRRRPSATSASPRSARRQRRPARPASPAATSAVPGYRPATSSTSTATGRSRPAATSGRYTTSSATPTRTSPAAPATPTATARSAPVSTHSRAAGRGCGPAS